MQYLHWKEETLPNSRNNDAGITKMYDDGFVFTRIGKGVMHQTRSVRIDLSRFEVSSENRRILKKTDGIVLDAITLPIRDEYDWKIGKLAKDFYDTKFAVGTISAQKIKEMLTDGSKSNFNTMFEYSTSDNTIIGHSICYTNPTMLHYSYPFYDLESSPKDMGLGMMIRAIQYAKKAGMKYIYLGSLQRPNDTYKLQFTGLEWFDGEKWNDDFEPLKEILK